MIKDRSNLTWTALIFSMWIFLIFGESVREEFTRITTPDTWITATIEVLPAVGENGKPGVRYQATPFTDLKGNWTAWVSPLFDGKHRRGCGGSGEGDYSISAPVHYWKWEEYLGRDCAVPKVPYRLCVRYTIIYSGVYRIFGPYCSETVGE